MQDIIGVTMLEKTCLTHVLRTSMVKTATRLNGKFKDKNMSTQSVKTVSDTLL